MMMPGEFIRTHRNIPWKQRTVAWWDTFSFVVSVIIAVVSTVVIGILFPADGFDMISLLIIIVVSYLFIRFGWVFERLLIPVQPPLNNLPGIALTVIGLVLPFVTAFLINTFSGLSSYALIVINVIIGTCIATLFIKIPRSLKASGHAMPPGIHLVAGALLCLSLLVTRTGASPVMMPGCSSICPVSIGFAGAVTAAISAAVNSPSVLQRVAGKSSRPAATAVISGKSAMDLLSGNGLAGWDPARKGLFPEALLVGWMRRPAADPLTVRGSRVIAEEKERGKIIATARSIRGFRADIKQDGTLKTDDLALVVEQIQAPGMPDAQQTLSPSLPQGSNPPGSGPGGSGPGQSTAVTTIGGAPLPESIGLDARTAGRVIDTAGGAVQTTVDFTGTTYGVSESAAGKGARSGEEAAAGSWSVPGDEPARSGGGGAAEPIPRFCRNCGAPVTPAMVFCNQCGSRLVQGQSGGESQSGIPPARQQPVPGASPSGNQPPSGSSDGSAPLGSKRGLSVTGGEEQDRIPGPGGEPGQALSGAAAVGGTALPGAGGIDPGTAGRVLDTAGGVIQTTVDYTGAVYASPVRFCRSCGAQVSSSMKFCGRCGKEVFQAPSSESACPKCRNQLKPGMKFCNRCGTPVEPAPAPARCQSCGHDLVTGSVYCRECGKKIG